MSGGGKSCYASDNTTSGGGGTSPTPAPLPVLLPPDPSRPSPYAASAATTTSTSSSSSGGGGSGEAVVASDGLEICAVFSSVCGANISGLPGGGDSLFAAIEVMGTPPGFKSQLKKDVILIVDVSGSMCTAMTQVHEAVNCVARALGKGDRLGIVSFNNNASIILRLCAPTGKEIASACKKLVADGGTNIEAGIREAYELILDAESMTDGRITTVILLSDGQPNSGISNAPELCEISKHLFLSLTGAYQVLFHSLGFTDGHDRVLLSQLTQCGNFGKNGMYYSLSTNEDIRSSVGDCLGGSSHISASNIVTTCNSFDREEHLIADGRFLVFTGQNQDPSNSCNLPLIAEHQRHIFLMYLPSVLPSAFSIKVTVTFQTNDKRATYQTIDSKLTAESPTDHTPQFLKVASQILRVRVGNMLSHASDSAFHSLANEIETLHDTILQIFETVQLSESDILIREEQLLDALERDLGEALDMASRRTPASDAHKVARLLQFSSEHLHQQSASTASHVRDLYTTPQQNAMRLRFLGGTSTEDVQAAKRAVPLEEPKLTEAQLSKRREVEEECCYVSLENWRTCHLGIGLLVRPRTARERFKNLMPRVELVQDYLSSEAYDAGVRAAVTSPTAMLDREDAEEFDKHSMMRSSVRERVNAWLPLYINSTNWKYSKHIAPPAFSIIATQFNDLFQPIFALKVCSKLLIQSVVKFMVEDQHASERALQMYCDVHRLFLQVAVEYPEVVTEAERILNNFITLPSSRCRKETPDLGDMIEYLAITDAVSWEALKEPYIQEAVRRNIRHIEHIALHTISGGVGGLLDTWMKVTNSGRVTMFNVLFLRTVARPEGMTIDQIRGMYDANWGKLPNEIFAEMKKGPAKIFSVTTLPEVFNMMGINIPPEAIAELILWGFENREESASTARYQDGLPKSGSTRLEAWLERCKFFEDASANPPPELAYRPPLRSSRSRVTIDGVGAFLSRLQLSDNHSDKDTCQCSKCEALKAIQLRREQWHPERNPNITGDPVKTVLIAGVPSRVTEVDIKQALSQFGPIATVSLVKNRAGKHRHFGFVVFESAESAAAALKNQTVMCCEATITLDRERGRSDPNFTPHYFGSPAPITTPPIVTCTLPTTPALTPPATATGASNTTTANTTTAANSQPTTSNGGNSDANKPSDIWDSSVVDHT
ncbi:Ubiquitinconjugating enzyme subfamily protein [Pelomyxa schiedti]|nr:Ubiquitinconjugating enzyme subfamily protein [Pelomyxa schiedti]